MTSLSLRTLFIGNSFPGLSLQGFGKDAGRPWMIISIVLLEHPFQNA